jgi:hypothetical protein
MIASRQEGKIRPGQKNKILPLAPAASVHRNPPKLGDDHDHENYTELFSIGILRLEYELPTNLQVSVLNRAKAAIHSQLSHVIWVSNSISCVSTSSSDSHY